jgi:hypothetical protein
MLQQRVYFNKTESRISRLFSFNASQLEYTADVLGLNKNNFVIDLKNWVRNNLTDEEYNELIVNGTARSFINYLQSISDIPYINNKITKTKIKVYGNTIN